MPPRSKQHNNDAPTKKAIYVGIDPGKQGGIAAIYPNKDVSWWLMPDGEKDLLNVLMNEIPDLYPDFPIVCGLEKVATMPGEGHKGAFTFGRGYGQLEMAVACAGYRRIDVTPRTWQKEFRISTRGKTETKNSHKDKIRLQAHRYFPNVLLWGQSRTKGKQLQICDAMFLAEYVRIKHA